MNCPNCKQMIPEDITVCPYCGTIIPQPEPRPYNPQPSYAPQPQQSAYGSQPQQPAYGSQPQQPAYYAQPQQYGFPEQTPSAQDGAQPEPKKRKGASKAVIAVVAVVLVAVIAAVGIFLVSRKDGDTNKKDASTAQVDGKDSNNKNGLEKVGVIDRRITVAEGGMYYGGKAEKYGVISFDGKNDTGKKYASVDPVGDYFAVETEKPKDEDDLDAINSVGLIDGNGEEIIPAEYATYKALNERYIKVCEATEKTESEDDALLFLTDNIFSLGTPDDDDVLYKGNWYIFDLEKGSIIPDVTGTKGYLFSAYGGCVQYVTDDEETVVLNGKGEELPESARVFDNGCYAIDDDGAVYTADGKILFEYDSDSLNPNGSYGKYFTATKYNGSGDRMECVLNRKGKAVSVDFDSIYGVYGDLVADGDYYLYDFDGNKVVDEKFDHFYMDDTDEKYVACENDKKIVYLKANGKLIDTVSKKNGVEFESYNLLAYKEIDDDKYYYSFKDKDFSVKGDSLISWYVRTEDGENREKLVNVMTGKTVLTDYSGFSCTEDDNGVVHIFARHIKDDGVDVYALG